MRTVLVYIAVFSLAGTLLAQDPFDPFGGNGSPAAGNGATGDPFAPAKPEPPPPKQAAKDSTEADAEKNPVVLALRESNPTTPSELMFAVRSLIDMGFAGEALVYLKKLVGLKPDPKFLLGIHREHGSAFFFRMTQDQRLKPDGEKFGMSVLDAVHKAARDPKRLTALVKQLSHTSPAMRRVALDDLRGAGTAALTPMLNALADAKRGSEHPQIHAAFLELGKTTIDPLLGALESPNDDLRVQIIKLMGEFKTPKAIPFLVVPYQSENSPPAVRQAAARALSRIVGTLPARYDVERFLYHRAKKYYEGALPGPLDYQDRVEMWHWNRKKNTVQVRSYSATDASRMMAARVARELYQLTPDNTDFRRLFLMTNLDFDKSQSGLDRPLPRGNGSIYDQAVATGVQAVEDVLASAVRDQYVVAATAAAEVLGDIGDQQLLQSEDGRPRPLASAMRHGDRRLRVAAANAIMKIDPKTPYPGSSFLTETLGYLVRTIGSRRALVAHPNIAQSQNLVGLLNEIGFEADAAHSGKQTFRLAARNPDYELVMISDAIDFPDARETIQWLRRDPRTNRLPVGVMTREQNLRETQDLARRDPYVEAFPRAHGTPVMGFQTSRLLELAARSALTYDQRLDQASQALDHLVHLAESPADYAFYDLLRQQSAIESAFFTPPLSAKAAVALGLLASPEAQLSLVTLASQHARPLEHRQAAAKSFEAAVQRRGLLLKRDEILLQYDRYNHSESLDGGSQAVLTSILDTIEARREQEKTQGEDDKQGSPSVGQTSRSSMTQG